MVEMAVRRIGMDQNGQALVILGDMENERLLPILIGPFEAHAIAMEMRGEKFERPLTHDLFIGALDALGYRVTQVDITRLDNGIFYALLHLSNGGHAVAVDSRPSDAIALALRADARIFVDEQVLAQAQVLVSDIESRAEEMEMDQFRELMARVKLSGEWSDAPPPDAPPDDDPSRTEGGQ